MSFMEPKVRMYQWPDDPDEWWEGFDNIAEQLPDPVLFEKRTSVRNYFICK